MKNVKSFFPSFKDFNGDNLIFHNGSVAFMRGSGGVSIHVSLDSDKVLFADGLKANFISLSQFCYSDLSLPKCV